ncbi:MAG: thiamine phosphate synthase [Prevotella sp.]|nr:thiamine phosphate synthase [Prevotella sp.]
MIIVITRPDFFEGEAAKIAQLLQSGRADLVHIRKPRASQSEVEQLLLSIPTELYSRLVLHDHHSLAIKYGLRGVHLNSRNPEPPAGWSGAVSISCHTLSELSECRRKPYAYMSLSPVFDSISKRGYRSAFSADDIAAAHSQGLIDERVMALGGITFDRISEVTKMGFGGAMILGDAWK